MLQSADQRWRTHVQCPHRQLSLRCCSFAQSAGNRGRTNFLDKLVFMYVLIVRSHSKHKLINKSAAISLSCCNYHFVNDCTFWASFELQLARRVQYVFVRLQRLSLPLQCDKIQFNRHNVRGQHFYLNRWQFIYGYYRSRSLRRVPITNKPVT